MTEFKYTTMFPLGKENTPYRLITKEHVKLSQFNGKTILVVEPEALTELSRAAFKDVAHLYRPEHLEKLQR
ncbi:MAG: fumarate hydratase, partial [Desulfamplus sp.]|nr:fumarate hydratase [Desulfamplus sp.]